MGANFNDITGILDQNPSGLNFDSLQDLFLDELKDINYLEKACLKELKRFSESVSSSELKEAFNDYTQITTAHLSAIESVFVSLNIQVETGEEYIIDGIIRKNDKLLSISDINVRDAAIIAAAEKIAHLKIATFGTLKAFAKELDYAYAIDAFQDAIDDEVEIDDVLSDIAEDYINENAVKE